jgi:hypothetical protein
MDDNTMQPQDDQMNQGAAAPAGGDQMATPAPAGDTSMPGGMGDAPAGGDQMATPAPSAPAEGAEGHDEAAPAA